jgi:AcrR family transcriptional regulator
MSIGRERLTPEESRAAALEAARALLIESGPQAVTLKAVAARVGKTHANILHHFGSAGGLQTALARDLAERVTAEIGKTVELTRSGQGDPREIVDRTFDAFGKQGAGALAAWMILSGNRDALDPVLEAIHRLVDRLGEGRDAKRVQEITLSLVLTALGDSLLGAPMAEALSLPRDSARAVAARHLIAAAALGSPDQ